MRNAALDYRRAFSVPPSTQIWPCIPDASTVTIPERDQLIEQGRDALEMLHKAARCTPCDWGKQAQDSVNVDDFSGSRCLAMLAMLRADVSFCAGDDQAGLDDLVAVMALGRHIGQETRVSGLAGFPLEDLAVKKAFEVLDRLDPRLDANLRCFSIFFRHFPIMRARFVPSKAIFGRTTATSSLRSMTRTMPRSIRQKFGLPAATEANSGLLDFVIPAGDPAERMLLASGGTRLAPWHSPTRPWRPWTA